MAICWHLDFLFRALTQSGAGMLFSILIGSPLWMWTLPELIYLQKWLTSEIKLYVSAFAYIVFLIGAPRLNSSAVTVTAPISYGQEPADKYERGEIPMRDVDLTSKCDALDFFVIMSPSPIMSRKKKSPFHWNISIKISVITLTPLCHFYSWYFLINPSIHFCTILQIVDM